MTESVQKVAYTAAVITVSDRGAAGEREDASGPALVALLAGRGYDVVRTAIVPDERTDIERELRSCAEADVALVLTTGGTGFSPRDVTPEATAAVCERMAPGIPEAMRAASMQITDRACLSREAAVKAALENVSAVIGPIAHGLRILRGGQADCAAGE